MLPIVILRENFSEVVFFLGNFDGFWLFCRNFLWIIVFLMSLVGFATILVFGLCFDSLALMFCVVFALNLR